MGSRPEIPAIIELRPPYSFHSRSTSSWHKRTTCRPNALCFPTHFATLWTGVASVYNPLHDLVLKHQHPNSPVMIAITIGIANPVPANKYTTQAQYPPMGMAPPISFAKNP